MGATEHNGVLSLGVQLAGLSHLFIYHSVSNGLRLVSQSLHVILLYVFMIHNIFQAVSEWTFPKHPRRKRREGECKGRFGYIDSGRC